MRFQSSPTWLALALPVSLVLFVFGARSHSAVFATGGALVGATAIVLFGAILNARLVTGRGHVAPLPGPLLAAHRNSALMSVAYGWGGVALLSGYYLSDLRWQHAWQYALAMLIVSGVLAGLSAYFSIPREPGRQQQILALSAVASTLQFAGAAVSLAYLVLSGTLESTKGDWAANSIFLAGGLAIALLSAFAIYSHRHLGRDGR